MYNNGRANLVGVLDNSINHTILYIQRPHYVVCIVTHKIQKVRNHFKGYRAVINISKQIRYD